MTPKSPPSTASVEGGAPRTFPESPDGSFWVEWREWDRGERAARRAWARSQLGGAGDYSWDGSDWVLRGWLPPAVSGRSQ